MASVDGEGLTYLFVGVMELVRGEVEHRGTEGSEAAWLEVMWWG